MIVPVGPAFKRIFEGFLSKLMAVLNEVEPPVDPLGGIS
jgi:hypothetical protein